MGSQGVTIPVKQLLERALDRDDFLIVDLHTHILTTHQFDFKYAINEQLYPEECKKRGIDAIVQTEHNMSPYTTYFADKLRNKYSLEIIPGMELGTRQGHVNIIGLTLANYDELLEKFSKRLIADRRKENTLYLDYLIKEIDRNYTDSSREPIIVFPHAFQEGGILKNPSNRKKGRLWLPPKYGSKVYFYEWTNGHRSVDTNHAKEIISLIKNNHYNIFLVGGSDCNGPAEIGNCGNIIFGGWSSFSALKDKFKAGEHIVYHILTQQETRYPLENLVSFSINIMKPDGTGSTRYSCKYINNEIVDFKKSVVK